MSFLESLGLVKKGTFVKEEGNGERRNAEKTPPLFPLPTGNPLQNTFNAPVFATTAGTAKVDYLGHFKKLLKDENLPGPDYIEFSEGLEKMNNVPLTEQQKYENVFAVLSSMGLTVDKLTSSAVTYLQKIEAEEMTFGLEYKGKEKMDIIDVQGVIATIEKENEELNKKILANNQKINSSRINIQEAQQRLLIEKGAFEQAVNTMKQIINNHVHNIKSYLNVTTTKQ